MTELGRMVGEALLHSLWQGAVVALLLLAIRPLLASSCSRYWAAYGARR